MAGSGCGSEELWGQSRNCARRAYLNYLEEEAGKGQQPELVGGGLVRSQGGWSVVKSLWKKRKQAQGDERILGSSGYHVVSNSSSEYAERLREQGYRLDKRTFKLFTFSPLIPGGHRLWRMNGDGTMTTDARSVSLMISSGKVEFVEHLVVGLLHQPFVQIGQQRFRVEAVKKLEPPELGDDMPFIMLSPLVCPAKRDGEKYQRFLLPGDEDFERVLLENLLGKYEALCGKSYEGESTELRFEVPEEYVERKHGKITKLITLKEGLPDETKIRGTFAPFRLRVSKELMEVGYYCGFGGLNAQGFGMVKVGGGR